MENTITTVETGLDYPKTDFIEVEVLQAGINTEPDTETDAEPEDIITCHHCGAAIEDEDHHDVHTDDGLQPYCPDCFNEHCFRCPDCDKNYLNEDHRIVYCGRNLCRSCSDNYYYCEGCHNYVHHDDFGDGDYCNNCAEQRDTGVDGYHENDDWEFIGQCKPSWKGKWRGIGVELEIDREAENKGMERCTVSDIRQYCRDIKFEYDGSLDYGFEIITHPHTVEEFYNIDWDSILGVCKANGYTSHSAPKCGLHVHFSRLMFGPNEKRQANAISKLINFFELFWEDILKVSRRTQQQADDYARKYGVTGIRNIKRLGKSKSEGRYYAVNNENYETVEIRIMRGTLNLKSFLACIDFCVTIVRNSRLVTWKDIANAAKWLKGIRHDTRDYIRSRNAFEGVV